MPASETGDAAIFSPLAPAVLACLYRVAEGVVPALPDDFSSTDLLHQYLEMRHALSAGWVREQRRGVLKSLDAAAFLFADRGMGEPLHNTLGTTFAADRVPCSSGSAWATRIAGLPDFLVWDPAKKYDSIISAPVIRAAVKDEYPLWLAATVSRVKAMAAPPAYSNLAYMPIPGPYFRRPLILPPSSHANSEQRARHPGFLISWNHQELCRLPTVSRPQFFAAVPALFSSMEKPVGITTSGSLVAYYARKEIYRSCRDPHSVTMAVWLAEFLLMACNR